MSELSLLRRAEALVGLPYVEGEFDCGHLTVLAQEVLFGRQVTLPLSGPHPLTPRAQAAAVVRCRAELGTRTHEPESGDAVLFTETSEHATLWHVGTLLAEGGQRWVLHTRAGGWSLLSRLDDCLLQGLRLEGFYRWK